MINLFDPHHQDFLKLLNKYKVEYLVIGGMAVNFHGYSRTTGDLDIWVNSTEGNKKNMICAIEEFGFDATFYKEIPVSEITMFSLGSRNEPGHIEITNRIAGIKFKEAFINMVEAEIDNILIKFLHIDDLIKNKKASGRHRDLDDVENLERIKKASK
jgi:predicted nucleotidyltransferase